MKFIIASLLFLGAIITGSYGLLILNFEISLNLTTSNRKIHYVSPVFQDIGDFLVPPKYGVGNEEVLVDLKTFLRLIRIKHESYMEGIQATGGTCTYTVFRLMDTTRNLHEIKVIQPVYVTDCTTEIINTDQLTVADGDYILAHEQKRYRIQEKQPKNRVGLLGKFVLIKYRLE